MASGTEIENKACLAVSCLRCGPRTSTIRVGAAAARMTSLYSDSGQETNSSERPRLSQDLGCQAQMASEYEPSSSPLRIIFDPVLW